MGALNVDWWTFGSILYRVARSRPQSGCTIASNMPVVVILNILKTSLRLSWFKTPISKGQQRDSVKYEARLVISMVLSWSVVEQRWSSRPMQTTPLFLQATHGERRGATQ
jgi:hypothetical protein